VFTGVAFPAHLVTEGKESPQVHPRTWHERHVLIYSLERQNIDELIKITQVKGDVLFHTAALFFEFFSLLLPFME